MSEIYEENDLAKELRKCNQTQKHRKLLHKKGCDLIKSSSYNSNFTKHIIKIPNITNFWINKPRKLAVCTPHKVGSQTWRYFFQQLDVEDQYNRSEQTDEYFAKSWPIDGAQYFKVD